MARLAAALALLVAVTFAAAPTVLAAAHKSFSIQNDTFYLDGAPFQIISGAMHYHRIHPNLWADRIARAAALGLNTIEIYIPWNFHEPRPGQYDFTGPTDLFRFISIAESYNLLVLVRTGPYICAEWDFGGLPAWLGSSAVAGGGTMRLRSSDPAYLAHVDRWWRVLLPRLAPLLRTGPGKGPVLMVQIENEFGLCEGGGDIEYLAYLAALAREILGNETVLFTTDPAHAAAGGTLPGAGVLTAVDFGPGWPGAFDPDSYFETQRGLNAAGQSPPLDSEFYSGWLTHWGESMANTTATGMAEDLATLLRWGNGASVNLYMAHGGTNFGLWAGANLEYSTQQYMPHITSYDYGAPISEAGQTCQPGIGGDGCKFSLIRDAIQNYTGRELPPVSAEPITRAYGAVVLVDVGPLMAAVGGAGRHAAEVPLPMEEYGQQRGIIVYRTTIDQKKGNSGAVIDFGETPHDYSTVLVGGRVVGRLARGGPANLTLPLPFEDKHDSETLEIVVEAMGRRNFGCEGGAWDLKGLQRPDVRLDGELLLGWEVFTFSFEDISAVPVAPRPPAATAHRRLLTNSASLGTSSLFAAADKAPIDEGPRFYRGALMIQGAARAEVTDAGGGRHLADTFLDTRGLGKGLAWINGFLLGWYWPTQGPQMTLYVPGPLLRRGANDVLLLETQDAPTLGHAIKVEFVDQPDFWGPEGKAAASEAGRVAVGPRVKDVGHQ